MSKAAGRRRSTSRVVAVVLAVGAAALVVQGVEGHREAGERVRMMEQRFRPAAHDLDAVAAPAYTTGSEGRSAVEDCASDSGETFQPSLVRSWTLTRRARSDDPLVSSGLGIRAAEQVARDLHAVGWRGSTYTDANAEINLRKTVGQDAFAVNIIVFDDSVSAIVDIRSLSVCH